ncbi:transcriptional regulator [Thermanaerovibrio velox DSM 12556]|uniref:Transcriptional regulator n=1 Tax=Thermanaerovibrio velox DSM 12556 TaxID=926567 RepID=H0UPI9_9BACT|nr:MarR family transcriptional regulator [Thermanaerovibrio velox]EHM10620.1 transcriptional regulator [Thermanaerovibrio velox DSM 12556]
MSTQERSLGRRIATLFRRSRLYLDRAFEPLGLGGGLYLYLALISRRDGITQRQMAEELALDEGTVARAVDKLVQEGWLKREKDPRDRRAFRIYLGPKGVERMPSILAGLQSWDERLARGLSPRGEGGGT